MKSVINTIFSDIKPQFDKLLSILAKQYINPSILVEKSNGRNYRVSKSGCIIKDNNFATAGAVIRVYNDNNEVFEYSFNDFSNHSFLEIPSIINKAFKPISDESYCTNRNAFTCPDIFNKSSEYLISPEEKSDGEITEFLNSLLSGALAYDSRIIDCVCIFQYLTTHKMYLSTKKDYEQHILWSNGLIQPLAKERDKTRYYLQTYSLLGGVELLEKMNSDIATPCKAALELLDSFIPIPGTYDVICMPEITGLIAHEAFGHGVEMDMFVKDRALAKQYISSRVASNLVTMHDNANSCKECGSYFFDDEGTLSNDTIIIDHGILVSGINDLMSAKSLNVKPTGNGRRESFAHKVYTRMTNTYFEPGENSLEEMIASIEDGLLLENGLSGMEDPKNWGIQCMVNIGREIKHGKLTGKIYSPICLSGYVPDLLKSITMVSNRLELSGCGYCGKGYKEWVKVSDGGPAIKARVTIS